MHHTKMTGLVATKCLGIFGDFKTEKIPKRDKTGTTKGPNWGKDNKKKTEDRSILVGL